MCGTGDVSSRTENIGEDSFGRGQGAPRTVVPEEEEEVEEEKKEEEICRTPLSSC
jgi:hypothetical protein